MDTDSMCLACSHELLVSVRTSIVLVSQLLTLSLHL